jgi:hypothetical protein
MTGFDVILAYYRVWRKVDWQAPQGLELSKTNCIKLERYLLVALPVRVIRIGPGWKLALKATFPFENLCDFDITFIVARPSVPSESMPASSTGPW